MSLGRKAGRKEESDDDDFSSSSSSLRLCERYIVCVCYLRRTGLTLAIIQLCVCVCTSLVSFPLFFFSSPTKTRRTLGNQSIAKFLRSFFLSFCVYVLSTPSLSFSERVTDQFGRSRKRQKKIDEKGRRAWRERVEERKKKLLTSSCSLELNLLLPFDCFRSLR